MKYTLAISTPTEDDIILPSKAACNAARQGHISYRPSGKYERGAVIVLSDMTKLQRLENIRRISLLNVSHELRTPITSIKGFVETLLDGAI